MVHFDAPPPHQTHPVRQSGKPKDPPLLSIAVSKQTGRYDMSYHAEDYEKFIKAEDEDPYVKEAPQTLPIPTLRWWWCTGHENKWINGRAFGNVEYTDGTLMGFQLPASIDSATMQQGSWVMVGDTGVYQLGVPCPRRPKQPKYKDNTS